MLESKAQVLVHIPAFGLAKRVVYSFFPRLLQLLQLRPILVELAPKTFDSAKGLLLLFWDELLFGELVVVIYGARKGGQRRVELSLFSRGACRGSLAER